MPLYFQSVLYTLPLSLFNFLLHELPIYISPFTPDKCDIMILGLLDSQLLVMILFLVFLHHMVVGDVADLSEGHDASIFRVEALYYEYKERSSVLYNFLHFPVTAYTSHLIFPSALCSETHFTFLLLSKGHTSQA
jgi:hypothetical protein